MRLLLDTHFAVWLATDRDKIRQAEMAAMMEPANELYVSAVSIWELRIKWNRRYRSGGRKGPGDPRQFFDSFREMGLPLISLEPEHAAAALDPPLLHPDPFDELLLTQAEQLGMKLFTRDTALLSHPLTYAVKA